MSNSLNSLNGGYMADSIGDYYIGLIKGDTRSLDCGSYIPKDVYPFGGTPHKLDILILEGPHAWQCWPARS